MSSSTRQATAASGGGGGPVYVTYPEGWIQPVTVSGHQTVGYTTVQPLVSDDVPKNVVPWFKSRQSIGLGCTLIVIGALSAIFNIVGIGIGDGLATVGYGLWCGTMFIITGGLGIEAGKKTKSKIKAFMILCILSALISPVQFGLGIGSATDVMICRNNIGRAMAALLAILAAAAGILSTWGSVICCQAYCACCTAGTTYEVSTVPYGDQQIMVISRQQKLQGVQFTAAQMLTPPMAR